MSTSKRPNGQSAARRLGVTILGWTDHRLARSDTRRYSPGTLRGLDALAQEVMVSEKVVVTPASSGVQPSAPSRAQRASMTRQRLSHHASSGQTALQLVDAPAVDQGTRRAPVGPDRSFVGDFARIPMDADQGARSGRPLPPDVQSLVYRTTKQVPDPAVRVHDDASTRALADQLGARAFTYGRGIHLGSASSFADTRLLFHEAIHTLQQQPATRAPATAVQGSPELERQAARATAAALIGAPIHVERGTVPAGIHRDAISDVRKKLSYGFLDWAITDTEAMEAFAMLAQLPAADLPGALKSLGSKYVTRLLDNLPDAAKSGPVYQQLVRVVGVAGSADYVNDLLSYSIVDWAVTDTDASRVYNIFANLPAAEQETMLISLEQAGRLGRLIDNSNDGHHSLYLRPWMNTLGKGKLTPAQKAIFHRIVDESQDGPIETLSLAAEKRFNVTVGPSRLRAPAVTWNPSSLSATYLALELLPDAHTEGNRFLERLGQFDEPVQAGSRPGETRLTGGAFNAGVKELAINTQDKDVRGTVLHETGHAVDAMLRWRSGSEPALPARGGWKDYSRSHQDCATDMVADSAAGIQNSLTPAQRTDVIGVMAAAMHNYAPGQEDIEDNMKAAIRSLPWFGALGEATQRAVLRDPALKALEVGVNSPWFDAVDGGIHLGAHVYQQSYLREWVRYRHEARARMVEPYQFRGPGEWFAVAYETYYTPDSRGKGAKLRDVDPDTKLWFDAHVDKAAATR